MSKGTSNFQIDRYFKEEDNEELKKNCVGSFSIDSITLGFSWFRWF